MATARSRCKIVAVWQTSLKNLWANLHSYRTPLDCWSTYTRTAKDNGSSCSTPIAIGFRLDIMCRLLLTPISKEFVVILITLSEPTRVDAMRVLLFDDPDSDVPFERLHSFRSRNFFVVTSNKVGSATIALRRPNCTVHRRNLNSLRFFGMIFSCFLQAPYSCRGCVGRCRNFMRARYCSYWESFTRLVFFCSFLYGKFGISDCESIFNVVVYS